MRPEAGSYNHLYRGTHERPEGEALMAKRSTKLFRTLRAAGSVMAIWPHSDYSQYIPQGTPQQRLARHWRHVGRQLERAVDTYEKARHAR